MALVAHGKVQNGGIVFLEPLALPGGAEVVISVEMLDKAELAAASANKATDTDGEEFASLACFGMWRDREEMASSADWVRGQRQLWSHRLAAHEN